MIYTKLTPNSKLRHHPLVNGIPQGLTEKLFEECWGYWNVGGNGKHGWDVNRPGKPSLRTTASAE